MERESLLLLRFALEVIAITNKEREKEEENRCTAECDFPNQPPSAAHLRTRRWLVVPSYSGGGGGGLGS